MKPNDEILQRLSQLNIFSDFPADTPENIARLEKICVALGNEDFKKGDIIIKEGDTGDTLYILYDGTVEIRSAIPFQPGEEFTITSLTNKQNVIFGELNLIDQGKRSASVIAKTQCKTLTLKHKDFIKLCEEDYCIGYRVLFKIAKLLSNNVRNATKDMLTFYKALVNEIEGDLNLKEERL